MLATLGDSLAYFRKRSDVNQDEVAKRLGITRDKWGRWERNEGRPSSAEEVEAIARALMMSYTDRATLLMHAGLLPSDPDIAFILERLTPSIEQWPHPAFTLDYAWRFMALNRPATQAFGVPEDLLRDMLPLHPCILEVMLDPKYGVRGYLEQGGNFKTLLRGQLYRFKEYTRHALNAEWMTDLMSRLNSCADFNELWNAPPETFVNQYRTMVEVDMVHAQLSRGVGYWLFWTESVIDPRFFSVFWVPKTGLEVSLDVPVG